MADMGPVNICLQAYKGHQKGWSRSQKYYLYHDAASQKAFALVPRIIQTHIIEHGRKLLCAELLLSGVDLVHICSEIIRAQDQYGRKHEQLTVDPHQIQQCLERGITVVQYLDGSIHELPCREP